MSVSFCQYCDIYVDTDYNVEHFSDNGKCLDERWFDRFPEYIVERNSEGLADNRCTQCMTDIKKHYEIIIKENYRESGSRDGWCSWNCVQDTETQASHWADSQNKHKKENKPVKTDWETGKDIL